MQAYFSFKGRIGRVVYLTQLIIATAFAFGALVALETLDSMSPASGWRLLISDALFISAAMLWLWTLLATTTKRLHDLGRSGVWVLFLLPPVLFLAAPVLGILRGRR